MRQVLIDKFVVPQNAFEEFTQRMDYNRCLIRNLPGFTQDMAYQQTGENGNAIVLTIAIWESQEAIDQAKATIQAEYDRIGYRPAAMFARLHITLERGIYQEIVRES